MTLTGTETGKLLTDPQMKEDLKNNGRLQGFLIKADLEKILGTPESNPELVGLRIYNADENGQDPMQVIAVGVKADGSEIQTLDDGHGYFLSHAIASPVNVDPAMPKHRTIAKACVTLGEDTGDEQGETGQLRFASYFSRTMIEILLDQPDVAGLCFHVVADTLSVVNAANHPNPADPPMIDQFIRTHMAITTRIADGEFDNNVNDLHMISEHPCPGICGPSSDEGTEAVHFTNNITEKYLVIW